MSHKYLNRAAKAVGTPPQSEPLDANQVKNNAGGYSYQVDPWKQLERFLILGTSNGTYYTGEQKLTFENVKSLEQCLKLDGLRTVKLIADISDAGRAVKNDPALFALAFAISKGDLVTRRAAGAALPRVARTGTHLFHFAQFAEDMRGHGRVLNGAIKDWYYNLSADRFGEQVIKYRQRDGWTHRDLFRLVKPKFTDAAKDAIAEWVTLDPAKKTAKKAENLPAKVQAHIVLQRVEKAHIAVKLILEHGLTWESVPTELLREAVVWEALLQSMPMTAMIRNLARMTAIGLLKPLSEQSKLVAERLKDEALLKRARVHPLNALIAMRTYAQGHGDKGSLTWTPVPQISSALEDAFYLAFKTIDPCGKNFYLALDVSGSMTSTMSGLPITCHEGTACMAMVTARKEPNYYVHGFTDRLVDLGITDKMSLEEAMARTHRSDFGRTDCGQPVLDAIARKLDVDCFSVYTDSETYAGKVHPKQALDMYRQKFGKPAKLVVVGMVANKFSIADPTDMGMLDVVGFDTATPQLISEFAK